MENSDVRNTLLQKLSQLKKSASVSDLKDGVKAETAKNPADLMTGETAGLGDGVYKNEHHEVPGATSQATTAAPDTGAQQGLEATILNTNESGKNAEVNAIEKTPETFIKTASTVADLCRRIAGTPEGILDAAMMKIASADEGDLQAQDELLSGFILKKASEGDPASLDYVNFCTWHQRGQELRNQHINGMLKVASSDTPKGATLRQMGICGEHAAQAAHEYLVKMATEAPGQLLLNEDGTLIDGVSDADVPPGLLVPEEDVVDGANLEAAAMAGDGGDIDPAEIAAAEAQADPAIQALQEVVIEVADGIIQANPEVVPEEALQLAAAAVTDAIQTADFEAAAGEVGEDGDYVMGDEEFDDNVAELSKTASANPARYGLVSHLTEMFQSNAPQLFHERMIKRASAVDEANRAAEAAAQAKAEGDKK